MTDLPACRGQFSVFTSQQARDCGLTRHQLRALVTAHRVLPLHRGVYVDAATFAAMTLDDRSRANAVAACLARPGTVVSHHSAALIHDLPLYGSRPARPTLTSPPRDGWRGVRDSRSCTRVADLPAGHFDGRGAWAITTVARTVCDCAREQPTLTAIVAADAALYRQLATLAELWAVANSCSRWPGIRRLRAVISQCDGRAESPYESVARWHLAQRAYPVIPQVWAHDRHGPIGCGDLWLPDLWTFLEVDGDVKYDSRAKPDVLVREKQRQERLERAGFGVARISAREARRASRIVDRVDQASSRGRLARLANPGATGFVGPPPPWASRGTTIKIDFPPR